MNASQTTLSLWFAKMDAFFHIPNPRIYRLLIISSTATFFLGLAMIIEWFIHGRHHPGYRWVVYYAPVMMALPVLVSLSLFFAIFFCDKTQIQHLPPKSKKSQPPPPQKQLQTKDLQLNEAEPLEDLQVAVQVQSIHSKKPGSTHDEASGCTPQLEESRCEEAAAAAAEDLQPHVHDSIVISLEGVTPAMVAGEEDMEPVAVETASVHDSAGFLPHVVGMMMSEAENNKGKDLAQDSSESTLKETCLGSPDPAPGGKDEDRIVTRSFSFPFAYATIENPGIKRTLSC